MVVRSGCPPSAARGAGVGRRFPRCQGRQLHGVDGVLCRHRRLICAMVVNFDGSGAPLISEAPGGT
jgi:hypothetical protein